MADCRADAAEAAGAKLLANANVYKLEHDEKGSITAALYYDPDKTTHRVIGKTFIVAANGIESPRLLLLSTSDKFPNGLANSSDMVGRNLMDHPSTSLTFDADEEVWLGRGPQSPSSINTMRDGAVPLRACALPAGLHQHLARRRRHTKPDRSRRLRQRTGKASALQRGPRDEREERA